MTVYERFIANDCPPENGSVLWINTSKIPLTLNMRIRDEWHALGAFYDADALEKILKTLGEFTIPDATVASLLEYVRIFLTEATEAEINAMFE